MEDFIKKKKKINKKIKITHGHVKAKRSSYRRHAIYLTTAQHSAHSPLYALHSNKSNYIRQLTFNGVHLIKDNITP